MLAGITKNNDRATQRVEGARELLRAHGIELSNAQIVEVAYDIATSRKGFATLMEKNPQITALICGQDVIAYGAILEAQQRGMSIPADLSVTGFDDLELSQHIRPGLTTIRYDANDMWSKAAQSLISRMRGDRPTRRLIPSETTLVVRESTAAPKNPRHRSASKT